MRLVPSASLLCVIDVQERLLPVVPDAKRIVARCCRLASAAGLLDVARVLTEQYPKGLGTTPPSLASLLPPAEAKTTFSSAACDVVTRALAGGLTIVVLAGLETHVCVSQTALDLLAQGLHVFIAVDAVASRHAIDHETALRRLERAGAVLTTSEAILFEWCRSAEHPRFQDVRRLVLEG
jgi:nicotinamidase-related amidase